MMSKFFLFGSLCLMLASCSSEDTVAIIQEPQKPEPQFADFKLPSGTLWSKMNLGATSEQDPGYYYSWGEISPKDSYTWETYLWQTGFLDGVSGNLTKYVLKPSFGSVDRIINLLPEDDAAFQYMEGLRVPTSEQVKELFDHTSQEEITIDGKHYYLIASSDIDLHNAIPAKEEPLFPFEYIILPMAGYMENGVVKMPEPLSGYVSDFGCYWTSDLNIEDNRKACSINLNRYHSATGTTDDGACTSSELRFRGLNVRPVK